MIIQLLLIGGIILCGFVSLDGVKDSLQGIIIYCVITLTVLLLFVTLFMYDYRYNQGQQDALIGKQKFTLRIDKINSFEIKENGK